MKRKIISTKKSTDLDLDEMMKLRDEINQQKQKSKVDIGDGRNLITVKKTEESEKPPFKPFLTETQIAKALRKTLGNHSQTGKLLNVSQSAISQRVARSKKLQEVIKLTREKFIDMAESVIQKRLKALDFDAAVLVIRRLGYMRHWVEKSEIDIDQRVIGGLLVVPPQADPKEWEELAKKHQAELLGGDDGDEIIDVDEEDENGEFEQTPFDV